MAIVCAVPNRFTWLPLSVLLVSCGKGAPSPEAGQQSDSVVAQDAAAPAEPAEETPQGAQERRVMVVGEVEADIGGTNKRFVVSSDGKSHMVDAGHMKSVILNARPEADSSSGSPERLGVAIRGYDLRKVVGQDLTAVPRGRSKMPRRASVSYVDEQGTRFSAIVGKGPPFELHVTAYDYARQVEGTFSGTLVERDGERTIEVRDGLFSLRLAPTQ
jgi:hypothetical protein